MASDMPSPPMCRIQVILLDAGPIDWCGFGSALVLVRWIRIQIGNANTHPDQGGKNNPKKTQNARSGSVFKPMRIRNAGKNKNFLWQKEYEHKHLQLKF
jgi:hypothetical protein